MQANPDIEQNKDLVRAFVEAVNRRDWDRLDTMLAPDFTRHSCAAPQVNGRDELKNYLRHEAQVFPDGHESIEDMVAENDRVAVRHAFRGTQLGQMGPYAASGKVMTADYIAIYRIAGGVIAEAWAEWDNVNGLLQLGHFKPGARPSVPQAEP